jgi:ABC-type multidrug transport system ATPase subunit/peptidoglycan/LPS O-acetylase OafA/YrhL
MQQENRLHALDAVRAFALLLGVVFHAGFSFVPGMIVGLWATVDVSTGTPVSVLLFVSHIFRMSLFFFLAGFFGRLLFERRGARGFWHDRAKRILVPLVAGWLVVFPMLAGVWVWGILDYYRDAPLAVPPTSSDAGAFPLTHLWFLYYLLILYVIVVTIRSAVAAVDRGGALRRGVDAIVRVAMTTGVAGLLLALPIGFALYARDIWFGWWGIPTPDQSLIPQVTSLVGYGVAIAFGWLIHRQSDLLKSWRGQWPAHLAVAAAATGFCLWLAGPSARFTPLEAGRTTMAYAFAYAIAIWSWVPAIVGMALRFLSRESAATRYVADSSYWLYLVHLPVVAAIQVLVRELPWHWAIKFPLVLLVSFAVLFASYHWLVRFTFIGGLLNGRRHERRRRPETPRPPAGSATNTSNETAAVTTASSSTAPPLAELADVHQQYGKIVALDGVTVRIDRGELVAVLGPNGAGKSTAISLMLGLLEPGRGQVRLFGLSPSEIAARRFVGVMMQDAGLPPALRVREHIALACSYYPDPMSPAEAMARTGTTALADRRYVSLSAGQKRQVQFAIAICGRPRLLFLDEPSVGLDVQARERMWQTIRELVAGGASVVLTTHYLEEAEALADRVVVLAKGRVIAEGRVDEVRAVVGRKHITCSSDVQVEDVRAWPHVIDVRHDARRLRITATDAETVVRRLLAVDSGLRDLEVRPAGLSEAFAELTRDAA